MMVANRRRMLDTLVKAFMKGDIDSFVEINVLLRKFLEKRGVPPALEKRSAAAKKAKRKKKR